nr:hypothetical protein Iba_chr02bCG19200 [Ipomoea batatas]
MGEQMELAVEMNGYQVLPMSRNDRCFPIQRLDGIIGYLTSAYTLEVANSELARVGSEDEATRNNPNEGSSEDEATRKSETNDRRDELGTRSSKRLLLHHSSNWFFQSRSFNCSSFLSNERNLGSGSFTFSLTASLTGSLTSSFTSSLTASLTGSLTDKSNPSAATVPLSTTSLSTSAPSTPCSATGLVLKIALSTITKAPQRTKGQHHQQLSTTAAAGAVSTVKMGNQTREKGRWRLDG